MRIYFLTGAFLVCVLILLATGTADQVPEANNMSENIWNGTWESDYYTLLIQEHDQVVEGRYEPLNISEQDPGLLEGTVSADGQVLSGTWAETGPLELMISDDRMSYSGAGNVRADGSLNESESYPASGTRIESSFDPDQVWTGTWKTKRVMNTLTQNGTRVTGSHKPLAGIDDEPGLFEGNVSEDGKTLSGRWFETGNFSFTLSDDGSYWNGTYNKARNVSAGSDSWNATRRV